MDLRSCCLFLLMINTGWAAKFPVGAIFSEDDDQALKSLQKAFSQSNYELIAKKVDNDDPYLVIQAGIQLLQRNVLCIIASSTSDGFSSLPSLSRNAKVPLVAMSKPKISFESNEDMLVNLEPDNLRAVLDVMRYYTWSNVFYFYDQDGGPEKLQYILQLGSSALNIKVLGTHKLLLGEKISGILRQLEVNNRNTLINVLLDVDPNTASRLLLGLIRTPTFEPRKFHFVMMEAIDHTFWEDNQEDLKELSLSGIQIYSSDSDILKGALKPITSVENARTRSLLAKDAFKVVENGLDKFFRDQPSLAEPPLKYYANSNSSLQYGPLIKKSITDINVLNGSTGHLKFDADGQRRDFTLSIIESSPEGSQKSFEWKEQSGINVLKPAYNTKGKVFQMGNNTLYVTTVLGRPYMMLKDSTDKLNGNERYEGFCKDLMDLISHHLGFTYVIKEASDKSYGRLKEDGTWNGMIGEVLRNEADLAVSDLTRTSAREGVVDFSFPFLTVGISLMVREGTFKYLESSIFYFLHVFTIGVWACILFAFIVFGLLYYVVLRLTGPNPVLRTGTKTEVTILDSLWYTFSCLILRNAGIHPSSVSSRCLTAIWCLFVVVVISLYIGQLVTLLQTIGIGALKDNNALSFRTASSVLEESLNTGYPKIGLLQGGSTHNFFKTSRFAVHHRFFEHITKHPDLLVKNNAQGVQRVRESLGNYAFLMESASNEYYSTLEPCNTLMVPGTLDSKSYGIVMPKNSPYRNDINLALNRLNEIGDLKKLYNRYWDKRICDSQNTINNYGTYHSEIDLHQIAGLFYCLLAGIFITAIVTAVEFFIKKRKRNHHSVALTQLKGDSGEGYVRDSHHSSL